MEKTAKLRHRGRLVILSFVRIKDIHDSVKRMRADDCKEIARTFGMESLTKKAILKAALQSDFIAGHVLQY